MHKLHVVQENQCCLRALELSQQSLVKQSSYTSFRPRGLQQAQVAALARARILADLAVSVLQSAGRELAERPLTVEDEAIVHEDLQAPMLKHNEVSRRAFRPSPPFTRPSAVSDPAQISLHQKAWRGSIRPCVTPHPDRDCKAKPRPIIAARWSELETEWLMCRIHGLAWSCCYACHPAAVSCKRCFRFATQLFMHPLGWAAPVCLPMLMNSVDPRVQVFLDVEYCLMREKFHDIVTRTDGFKWVNEAKVLLLSYATSLSSSPAVADQSYSSILPCVRLECSIPSAPIKTCVYRIALQVMSE